MNLACLTVAAYGLLGLLFALWFSRAGAARLSSLARGADLPFKLIIVPATVALWPILLLRSLWPWREEP